MPAPVFSRSRDGRALVALLGCLAVVSVSCLRGRGFDPQSRGDNPALLQIGSGVRSGVGSGVESGVGFNPHQWARSEYFSRAFTPRLVSAQVQSRDGEVKHNLEFTDGGKPQACFFDECRSGDRSLASASFHYAHESCFDGSEDMVDAVVVADDDFLVLEVEWKAAQYILPQLRFPLHIHADAHNFATNPGFKSSAHNEVVPTNVWQDASHECPTDVGDPAFLKNKCRNSLFVSKGAERLGVGRWEDVYCPRTKIGMCKKNGYHSELEANFAVYEDFKRERTDFEQKRRDSEIAIGGHLQKTGNELYMTALFHQLVSLDRTFKLQEAMIGMRICAAETPEARLSHTNTVVDIFDDVMAADCPHGGKYCSDAAPCLPCCKDNMKVKIKGSKLRVFQQALIKQEERGDGKDARISDVNSVGLVLHDNHGAGGDSMGIHERLAMELFMRVYLNIRSPGDPDAKVKPSCPSDEVLGGKKDDVKSGIEIMRDMIQTAIRPSSKRFTKAFQIVVQKWNFILKQEGPGVFSKISDVGDAIAMIPLVLDGALAQSIREVAWSSIGAFISQYMSEGTERAVFAELCKGREEWKDCLASLIETTLKETSFPGYYDDGKEYPYNRSGKSLQHFNDLAKDIRGLQVMCKEAYRVCLEGPPKQEMAAKQCDQMLRLFRVQCGMVAGTPVSSRDQVITMQQRALSHVSDSWRHEHGTPSPFVTVEETSSETIGSEDEEFSMF